MRTKRRCACGKPTAKKVTSNYCAECHRAYSRANAAVYRALRKLRQRNPELAEYLVRQ